MPANTNAIGSTMRRSLDFGFLAGFALVAGIWVALVAADSVALVWLVWFLKSLFWQILLRKAYTFASRVSILLALLFYYCEFWLMVVGFWCGCVR